MRRILLFVLLLTSTQALAAVHQLRIPLEEGRLHLSDLTTQLQHGLHFPVTLSPPTPIQDIDLHTIKGALLLTAINESLNDAARVDLSDDALLLSFDPARLPRSENAAKKSIRTFVATLAPDATAAQRHSYGLLLPRELDPSRRLVVLVHGLDTDRSNWSPLAALLRDAGYQVAYFCYPSDQPIADSAGSFTEQMQILRDAYPALPTSVVAHSMGALIARSYVEGPSYAGGVDHLIMLAPPNHGTRWARLRFLLEIQEHVQLALHDPHWRPSWMVTDGLGEAGSDLLPHSAFLEAINSVPRREGVKYTIIAGTQHPAYPLASRALDRTARLIPTSLRSLPGLRQTYAAAERAAGRLAQTTGTDDGPLSTKSARLEGVGDFVAVPADHCGLQTGSATCPPASWPTIADRLAH